MRKKQLQGQREAPSAMLHYLTRQELARVTKTSLVSVDKAIHDTIDPLPHFRLGRRVLIKPSDFEQWASNRAKQALG